MSIHCFQRPYNTPTNHLDKAIKEYDIVHYAPEKNTNMENTAQNDAEIDSVEQTIASSDNSQSELSDIDDGQQGTGQDEVRTLLLISLSLHNMLTPHIL
jgi:hypothetical protein